MSRTTPEGPVFPAGRYGRRRAERRTPRWVLPLLVVGALVLGLTVAVALYRQYGDTAYQGRIIDYEVRDDTGIEVSFEVTRPAGKAASCLLRARSRNGAEVGHRTVTLAAGGPARVTGTVTIATTARAYAAELVRCRAEDGPADPP